MAEFILKDWYGNNCTFDKDKIFVQDVNGELVQFTQGKGNPTLETLEVTENGTYTPSEGVDGFNSVNVNVPTSEVTLQDKTITENGTFTADEGFDGLRSVTVAVEGSGGGSDLPAGVYLKPLEIPKPNSYYQKWVEFNGDLYAFTNSTSGNGYMSKVLKYQDGKWVEIISTSNTNGWSNAPHLNYVEYHGKLHIVGGTSKKHYVFDGSSLTALTALPDNVSLNNAFVQNDVLKIFCLSNQTVYVWNESDKTWTVESTFSLSKNVTGLFQTDLGIVACGAWLSSYYLYDGQSLTEFANVGTFKEANFAHGCALYRISSPFLYKFDMLTKTETKLCRLPGYNSTQTTDFIYNGKFHLLIGNADSSSNIGAVELIESSGGGGGSSADVRYVTFMNWDGTEELGKKAVAVGDDCADPIARGIFGKPTRESDAQYNYTHNGWSTEPNGAVNSNWSKAVTEDKTVYANFKSAVRYYTINYYDSDGTTVLKTESLAYGAMPSYVPSKSGYDFTGWEQELVAVNGEASYTATWTEEVTFATASWARIAEIAESGEAEKYFSVGDTKTIAFNFSGTIENVNARIIGFNHDNLANGSGKAGISIALSQGIVNNAVVIKENTSYGTGYIWKTSASRTLLNSGAVYNALPSELRSVLKTVTKISNAGYSKNYGGLEQNVLYETTDKVWLLSSTEFGIDNAYSSSYVALGQGEPYAYYADGSATKRKMKTTANENFFIPTRSMQSQYACASVVVQSVDGAAYHSGINGNTTCPRMFGFCI